MWKHQKGKEKQQERKHAQQTDKNKGAAFIEEEWQVNKEQVNPIREGQTITVEETGPALKNKTGNTNYKLKP